MNNGADRQANQHLKNMEALRGSLEMLNRVQTMSEAYAGAVTSIIRMLDCERASVLRFGADAKVHFVAWEGLSEVYRTAVDGHCPWAQNEVDAEPLFISNIATSDIEDELRTLIVGEGIQAAAFFPMIAQDRLLGKYMAYYKQPHVFSEEDRNFGKILADELVVTLSRLEIVEKMRASEQRLALALDAVEDGLWDWNLVTNQVYYSPRWESLLGYEVGSFPPTYTDWQAIIHPDDLAGVKARLVEHIAGDVAGYEVEYRLRAQNGDWVWVLDRGKVVARDEQGVALRAVGTHTDITRKKVADRERQILQTKVEHAQRLEALGVLAGGVAHDFNNLLTVILGNASVASGDLAGDPEVVASSLAKIVASAEKAALICRQMLAYSGRRPVVVKPVDLTTLVREIGTLLEVSIDKRVQLHYHLDQGLPQIDADESQIHQVIMNLVINAADACRDNKGNISLSTKLVRLDSVDLTRANAPAEVVPGTFVCVTVSDTGAGMDEGTKNRLFEPFFTTKAQGRGLGMSVVLGIARSHHAVIDVKSEVGQGTTFSICFPAENGAVVSGSSRTFRTAAPAIKGTVLVVDDDEMIRDVAQQMLERMGFATLTAVDGRDGVDTYRAHQTEIVAVLLDVTMPHLDGAGCLKLLREINPEVRVVLSSGFSESGVVGDLVRQGLAGFVPKPYTPDELKAALLQALAVSGSD